MPAPRPRPGPALPRAYLAAVQEHRRRLDRLADRYAPQQLRRLYREAQAELEAKLRAAIRGGKGATFTAHQQRMALAMVRDAQARIAARLAGAMGSVTEEVRRDAVRGIASQIVELEKRYTGAEVVLPIEEAARFRGIVDARRTSMIRMHRASFARYGAEVTGAIEDGLAQSLVQGETPAAAIDRVQAASEGEWWQAERIVRTETAMAYNFAHADAIAEAAEELPDLMMRWSEHVDPETGEPLDDRVSVDSLAMDSQIASPGELFTMPPTSRVPDAKGRTKVPEALVGETWEAPPNRPNDRSVLVPFSPRWGVPGWRWSNGRRVPVRDTRSAAERGRAQAIYEDLSGEGAAVAAEE